MSGKYIITEKLKKINDLKINRNILLSKYTSFKIGGPADIFITPYTIESLKKAIHLINKENIPYFVLGSGSNIIVSDRGYRGIIIYTAKLNKITGRNNLIFAQTGITLSRLAEKAQKWGLSGLEFASGIPGSLGGAIYMNAGAYGGEMKKVIKEVKVLNERGETLTLQGEDLEFSYRSSLLQNKSYIAVEAQLHLEKGNKNKIASLMKKLNQKRREKQPLQWPSAGSIFKRPADDYAGRLIEEADMKGISVGDAQVSQKHAGFIINRGNATASDVLKLIEKIQKNVYKKSGIKLEVEPRFLGEF
ncbi:MAG: UDP-N-acetylmuramate dehydrogenase [Halanaerobiales bacterium]